MFCVPINTFGPQGEIWSFGLVRRPPWSNHSEGEVFLAANLKIPYVDFYVDFSTAPFTRVRYLNRFFILAKQGHSESDESRINHESCHTSFVFNASYWRQAGGLNLENGIPRQG